MKPESKILFGHQSFRRASVFAIFLLILIVLVLLYPQIPYGFFTDEAKIGLTGWEFAKLDFSNFRLPFFYLHYSQYLLGALPPISVAPIVSLFGLSDFTIRVASSIYAFMGLCVAYATMRLLKFRYSLLAVILLLSTPIFYHLSRVQFGQTPSFLLIQLSLLIYYYLAISKSAKWYVYCIVGVISAIGCYGYSAYLAQIPLFMATWMIVEFITATNKREIIKRVLVIFVSFCVIYSGVGYARLTYPGFMTRLNEKQKNSQKTSLVTKIIQNYPKYYSPSYLFQTGEIGQPGAFVTRHSVTGSGIVYLAFVPLLFCCVAGIWFLRKQNKPQYRLVITSLIWVFITPMADIFTTSQQSPPYTISMYAVSFGLVYVLGFGLESMFHIPSKIGMKNKYIPIALLILFMILYQIETTRFFNNYRKYPQVSSDFWGWQWGPKVIIEYFQSQSDSYDAMYIEGIFNDPSSFIPIYTIAKPCPKCSFGNIEKYDPTKRQLFAVNPNTYNNLPNISEFKIIKVFQYPDNTEAFYIISKK